MSFMRKKQMGIFENNETKLSCCKEGAKSKLKTRLL